MLIPIPKHEAPEKYVVETQRVNTREAERVLAHLKMPNWQCPKCQTVVSGHTKSCPYCRERLKVVTLRPGG